MTAGDAARERRRAAAIHLLALLGTVLAPLAGWLLWRRSGTPWLRRHLRDALLHWGIAVALYVGALGLEAMNPVHDFGLVRLGALDLRPYMSLSRNYAALAWGASLPFAILSARRAARGQPSLYPFTLWWSAPHPAPPPLATETLEPEGDAGNGGGNGEAPAPRRDPRAGRKP